MGLDLSSLGMQAAQQGIGAIMGMATAGWADRRQIKQQGKLQKQQIEGNKQMIDYQKMKDLEMWKSTGPVGMMAELDKAGLNKGLYYGMTGGGGTTTGGSGSVQGGQAPSGGREIQEMTGMGMQLALLEAQKANIEANTEKTKAETAKTSGVDTNLAWTTIDKLIAETQNTNLQKELTKLQTDLAGFQKEIQGATVEYQKDAIKRMTDKLDVEVEEISRRNEMNEAQKKDLIKTTHAEMLGAFLRNALTAAQTKNTTADTKLKGTQGEALIRNWVQQAMNWEVSAQNANTNQSAQEQNEWVNDVSNSLGLPVSVVREMVDGIFRKK